MLDASWCQMDWSRPLNVPPWATQSIMENYPWRTCVFILSTKTIVEPQINIKWYLLESIYFFLYCLSHSVNKNRILFTCLSFNDHYLSIWMQICIHFLFDLSWWSSNLMESNRLHLASLFLKNMYILFWLSSLKFIDTTHLIRRTRSGVIQYLRNILSHLITASKRMDDANTMLSMNHTTITVLIGKKAAETKTRSVYPND